MNKNNQYKDSYDDCTHAALINDDIFIDYLISVVDDPKVQNEVTDAKKLAAKNYDANKDYESVCNSELKYLLETAK